MYRKTLILSAAVSFILISLIFLFLFHSVKGGLEEERRKADKYLITSVSNGIQGIRNEVLYLYDYFSGMVQELNGEGWDGDPDSLPREEEYQLDGFPSLVKRIDYMEKESFDNMSLLKGFGNVEELYGEIIARLTDSPTAEMPAIIHIFDFSGYMVFPVKKIPSGDYCGFLVVFLNIRPAVEEFLPSRLGEELTETKGVPLWRRNDNYRISLMEGSDLEGTDFRVNWTFDLSRSFNLFRIRDYYFNRSDQFLILPVAESVTDNHLYLTLSRESGTASSVDRGQMIRSYGLLSLLYLAIMGALLLFLYSVWRIQEHYRREQQFTSLISHELKTPLSVIRLAADNLSGGYVREPTDIGEYGAMIREESDRLGRMIENILLLSTLSWARKGESRASAEEIVESLYRKNLPLLKSHGVTMVKDCPVRERVICPGSSFLEAALNNLIHNGIIYGASRSEDRTLILRLEKRERKRKQGILFSVIDHGPGISWSESQKIFEDFTRGEDVREKQMPGSGLGLSLSRKIAETLGGTLHHVRSMKRETVFELWIPVRMENEENIDD